MNNKPLIHSLEVSTSLHEKLLKSPVYAQKMKNRSLIIGIISTLLILFNLFYFMSNQETIARDRILESQYANFGSDLSI